MLDIFLNIYISTHTLPPQSDTVGLELILVSPVPSAPVLLRGNQSKRKGFHLSPKQSTS